MTFILTFTMIFSGGIIPLYLLMRSLGMINTVWSLVLPNSAAVYLIIIARTFFRTGVPKDLYDAAEIDGAGFTQTFIRIVVPLSTAIIAVVALFKGVQQWNNFFRPLLFITDQEKYPLPLILRNILLANEAMSQAAMEGMGSDAMAAAARRGKLAETMKYSLIVIATFPVLLIYPFLQKYFMTGVMLGSIKG
jgi:putative aldouronate transport system permease protein